MLRHIPECTEIKWLHKNKQMVNSGMFQSFRHNSSRSASQDKQSSYKQEQHK